MRFMRLALAIFCLPVIGSAQTLDPPSWSKPLNARTVVIDEGWQFDVAMQKPAHLVAVLQISSQTDWENTVHSAATLSVAMDGRLCSHLVTYLGREFHQYEIHLGLVMPGGHTLEILRADTAPVEIKLVNVRLDAYEENHPQYAIFAHAPIIFGREEMRYSDLPLLLAYDARWREAPGEARRLQTIEYTAVFSNESGGTPPVGLLHAWGRYADIEWVYRVELEADGKTRKRAFYQGAGHKILPFRGGFENGQPALQVATLNNMMVDTLNNKLRFALPPRWATPTSGLRERLLLQAPWTWRVCAKEARREQRAEKMLTDSTRLADLRQYLFIQFAAHPQTASTEGGGFFAAKYRRQTGEYASHLWSPRLMIRGAKPFVRQTALAMPAGATPEDLVRLDFVADPAGQKIVLSEILNLFTLDHNDLPRIAAPSWKGGIALDPGERVRFHIDTFQMLPEKSLALPELWAFRADSALQGDAEKWWEPAFDDKAWAALRPGISWEQQGFAGYRGVAWYRLHFKPEQSWRGEKVWLGLNEVAGEFAAWLNGKPLSAAKFSDHPESGRAVFDLTAHAQTGKDNIFALRVDGREQPGGLLAKPSGIRNLLQALVQPGAPAMADPAIDQETPFDYFARPSAFIGTLENGVSAQITPEGGLYTGAVELMFYGGASSQPLVCNKKTLVQGDLPIVNYQKTQEGIDYHFEAFALPGADSSAPPAMNYLQVTLRNHTNAARSTRFAVGLRFRGAEEGRLPARLAFNPLWHYRLNGKFVQRDDEVLCAVSIAPHSVLFPPQGAAHQPESLTGMIEYQFTLAPGETQRVNLCVPQNPLRSERVQEAQLTFDYDRSREEAVRFWQNFLQQGANIFTAEDKVNRLWRAQLIYHAIVFGPGALREAENPWHDFTFAQWGAAARVFDAAGYHDLARAVLQSLLLRLQNFAPSESEGLLNLSLRDWGTLLWALDQHVQVTGDRLFAGQALPPLRRWLEELYQQDRREQVRLTNDAQIPELPIALLGLKHAQVLANLARDREAEKWAERLYHSFEKKYRVYLDLFDKRNVESPAFSASPTAERMLVAAAYPGDLLPPADKRVSAAALALRNQFEEGLAMKSARWLDADLTLRLAQSALQNTQSQAALQDFYALLLHTGATHLLIGDRYQPWGDRQSQDKNFALEGMAGELLILLQSLILREEGRDLRLFEAVSPAWLQNNDSLKVEKVATAFGKHSFSATMSADKMTIAFQNLWRVPPRRMLLRVPDFFAATSAQVDGKAVAIDKGWINVPPLAGRLEIQGRNLAAQQRASFALTVNDFKREYAGKYEVWKREFTGKN